jgi:hypothetical protein
MKNRTGMQMSPADSKELIEATSGGQFASSSLPDPERDGLAETRAEYHVDAGPLGTVPAPMTAKGMVASAAKVLTGDRLQVFMDKLAERAAFERGGVRLYDALLAKHRGEITSGVHGTGAVNEVSYGTLLEFRDQEAEHFLLVSDAIKQLGGDPTAQTPCADVVGVMSMGLVQVVSDPRTTLTQSLSAILTAELSDVAGWDLLAKLADSMGQDKLASKFRLAMGHEERHLLTIRDWHETLIMGESGQGTERNQGETSKKSAGKSSSTPQRKSSRKSR